MQPWLKLAAQQMLNGRPTVSSMLGTNTGLGQLRKPPSEHPYSLTASLQQPQMKLDPLTRMPMLGRDTLGGRARLKNVIQTQGPLSTTGDFGSPNAGQGVKNMPKAI